MSEKTGTWEDVAGIHSVTQGKTCASCAKWTRLIGGMNPMDNCGHCERKQGGCIYTWPDATCPAWERRRDKLDERAEEMWRVLNGLPEEYWLSNCRALLAKWAAEDKEAK